MHTGQDAYWAEVILDQPLVLSALVFGSLLAGLLALVIAQQRGWRKVPAVLAGCGLALALAVTLARPGVLSSGVSTVDPMQVCLTNDFSLTGSLERLNFLMLTPFAFFGTLATRRPFAVLVASAVVSMGVEGVQAATYVGVCETQDFFNNTVGAAIAVLVAWLLNLLVTAAADTPRTTPAGRRSPDPAATR